MANPIQDIEFGTALKISLDNYYDLLKLKIGNLGSNEFLQLKLFADSVDINPKPVADKGYKWWSYHNIVRRGDLRVDASPVSGIVLTGAERLSTVYGEFLARLREYAILRDLTPQEQQTVADQSKAIQQLKNEIDELIVLDRERWIRYADLMGIPRTNNTQYIAWSNAYGERTEILNKMQQQKRLVAQRRRILDRVYQDIMDRRIIEAEIEYENPFQSIRYPIFPDYDYDDGDRFSATYLGSLPNGSSGLFDDRKVIMIDKSLETLKNDTGGNFTATFDHNTAKSESITTDWGGSGSVTYGFIKASASASEHRSIQEDFRKGVNIELGAKSVYKSNFIYPRWFDPTLFSHKRVKENIRDFEDYFGPKGLLRYYPVSMITIRGFKVAFNSTQKWQFDYVRKFSASSGGGFSAFGVNFGGSASYSQHEERHEVDQSNTKLTIEDGETTIRYVGITVKENTVFDEATKEGIEKALPKSLFAPVPGKKKSGR